MDPCEFCRGYHHAGEICDGYIEHISEVEERIDNGTESPLGQIPMKKAEEIKHMPIVLVSQLKMKDGRTLKEHNMEISHEIPLKALVEIEAPDLPNYHGMRLFVCSHTRDCDGTPLYSLGDKDGNSCYFHGFNEEILKLIDLEKK